MNTVAGERATSFVLKHLTLFGGLSVVGLALGVGIAALSEQIYFTEALIEVGARPPKDPAAATFPALEDPILAAERLAGRMAEIARQLDPRAEISVKNLREHDNSLNRYIDTNITAHSSSAADAILNGAIAKLITDHHA